MANENGEAQIESAVKAVGDVRFGLPLCPNQDSRSGLGRPAIGGDSPVGEILEGKQVVSRVPALDIGLGMRVAPSSKAKHYLSPIAYKYREGKLKSIPEGRLKEPETRQ